MTISELKATLAALGLRSLLSDEGLELALLEGSESPFPVVRCDADSESEREQFPEQSFDMRLTDADRVFLKSQMIGVDDEEI